MDSIFLAQHTVIRGVMAQATGFWHSTEPLQSNRSFQRRVQNHRLTLCTGTQSLAWAVPRLHQISFYLFIQTWKYSYFYIQAMQLFISMSYPTHTSTAVC